jgi:26S proteasome regulatory subunit N9
VSWVQPRVLSLAQIGGLAARLADWVGKLSAVEARIAAEVEEK